MLNPEDGIPSKAPLQSSVAFEEVISSALSSFFFSSSLFDVFNTRSLLLLDLFPDSSIAIIEYV